MSIESGKATLSHKAVAGADSRFGKKLGRADAAGGDAAGGFSLLMGLMSAADATGDEASGSVGSAIAADAMVPFSTSTVASTGAPLNLEQNVTPALYQHIFDAMNMTSNNPPNTLPLTGHALQAAVIVPTSVSGLEPASVVSAAMQDASLVAVGATMQSARPLAQSSVDELSQPPVIQSGAAESQWTGAEAASLTGEVGANQERRQPVLLRPAVAMASAVDATELSVAAGSSASSTASGPQSLAQWPAVALGDPGPSTHKGKDVNSAAINHHLATDAREPRMALDMSQRPQPMDLGTALVMGGAGDSLVRSFDRSMNRSGGNRSVGGFEAVLGGSGGVIGRTDTLYQIEASAAVVPDTAIAETVSYWVTHGVQNAEMTLEGFGDEAVEVSISLQGDQALVDFRTDQPEVRLALEAANGELRELLANEGLQLAGLTIGASASKQSSEQGGQPAQQGKVLVERAEPAALSVAAHSVNPSVGRSLDVFV
jgi:hypothetical protein